MSSSVNKVILIGNLGAKPELKYLPSGQAVCEMRLATNEKWTEDGQTQEKTEWHRIKAWGKTGENCAQYLDKGRQIYVEVKLETRSWDDKNTGEKRYSTEIVALTVQFLGGGGGGDGSDRSSPRSGSRAPGGSREGQWPPPSDDDIPF